jgi:hypothetical protein
MKAQQHQRSALGATPNVHHFDRAVYDRYSRKRLRAFDRGAYYRAEEERRALGIGSGIGLGATAASGAAVPTPAQIMGANLKAFFIASAGLTATTWSDQSGNGLDFAGNCTVQTNQINGLGCAKFVAASSNKFSHSIAIAAPATTPVVWWGILRQDNWVNGTSAGVCGGNPNNYTVFQSAPSPGLLMASGAGTTGQSNGCTIGAFKRIEAQFTGSTSDRMRTGSTAYSGGVNCGSAAGTLFQIGFGASAFTDVSWACFAWFNAVPTSGQDTALDAWATSTFGASVLT